MVELVELLRDVGTDVAVSLFDGLGRLQTLLGRDSDLALSQQRLDETGDVATGDRDVLDAGADHVSLGLEGKKETLLSGVLFYN